MCTCTGKECKSQTRERWIQNSKHHTVINDQDNQRFLKASKDTTWEDSIKRQKKFNESWIEEEKK